MRLIRLLKNDLVKEVAEWNAAGIIDEDQASAICRRYGVDFRGRESVSYGHRILVGLGYLFIGLSLITLIGHNWEEIPRAVRMGGLVGLTLLANLAGLYRYWHDGKAASERWFLLGGLFYGASIILIAQVYHIGEHYPDGIFWWALGILPVALLLESIALLLLTATLAMIWFFVETGLGFYPLLFPLFLAGFAWSLRRGVQSNLLFLALACGVFLWAEYSLAWYLSDRPGFEPDETLAILGGGLLLLYQGIGAQLGTRPEPTAREYGMLLEVWVLRLLLISLLLLSFLEPWEALLATEWHSPGLSMGIALGLSVAASVLVFRAGRSPGIVLGVSFLFVSALAGLILLESDRYAIHFQVLDNVLLISLGIGLIVHGLRERTSHHFYLGVITIMITGLLRYFDLVGDYIGAAILFAVFAAILLSAARYWKSHQSASESRS